QREQADLVLPTASEIKENDKVKSDEPTTTVNVQHRQSSSAFSCPVNAQAGICREADHWVYVVRGRDVAKEQLKEQLKAEADETLEPDIDPKAGVRLSAR